MNKVDTDMQEISRRFLLVKKILFVIIKSLAQKSETRRHPGLIVMDL